MKKNEKQGKELYLQNKKSERNMRKILKNNKISNNN